MKKLLWIFLVGLVLLPVKGWTADTKISSMTEDTAPAATAVVPIVTGGVNKKAALGNIPLTGNIELKALATGILKNTTTSGTPSIAAAGTDYVAPWTVTAMDTGGNLTTASLYSIKTVSSGTTQTLNLPTIAAGNIGTTFTIVKLGAGQVTIQANTGQYIADSSAAGTIYNNQSLQTYATITIMAVTTTKWIIIGYSGTWTTS